ncbi:MAG TPA: hypothetical protein VLT88_14810 [Desulfosarcina sp.]|nr:hypothetical protein [Desulfosarcina sp.]
MNRKWMAIWAAAVVMAGIAACASPPLPFDYHDDRDEKPGPGLFSGEKGGFVIYGDPAEEQQDVEKASEESDAKTE